MQYIGELQIKTTEVDKEDVVVTFKDGSTERMKKLLFDDISSEKKGIGDVTDNIRTLVAMNTLKLMVDYGLKSWHVDHVSRGLTNLVINLKEQKIGEKFGVRDSMDIDLADLYE